MTYGEPFEGMSDAEEVLPLQTALEAGLLAVGQAATDNDPSERTGLAAVSVVEQIPLLAEAYNLPEPEIALAIHDMMTYSQPALDQHAVRLVELRGPDTDPKELALALNSLVIEKGLLHYDLTRNENRFTKRDPHAGVEEKMISQRVGWLVTNLSSQDRWLLVGIIVENMVADIDYNGTQAAQALADMYNAIIENGDSEVRDMYTLRAMDAEAQHVKAQRRWLGWLAFWRKRSHSS